jgi:hypothetical protein
MPSMKVLEVMRRVKGFSTPIGGIDWDLPIPQRAIARKVVVYLEDRRVLTRSRIGMIAVEDRDHCVASIQEIRETLTQILMEPETEDELSESLRAMRAACRRFLNTVGTDHAEWENHPIGHATFGAALGEIRAVFGIQIGIIAARYKIDLPEELAAILPASDIDDQ